jgi:hypothetical protein
MARTYVIPASNITLANQAVTLVWVNPGTTMSLDIIRCYAGYTANTTGAQQRVQLNTQVTAFPTLTSQAPVILSQRDPVSAITGATNGAAGTCGVNASAEGGTKTVVWPDGFYNLNGWQQIFTVDERIRLAAGANNGLGLHFPAAAGGSLSGWCAGIVFSELG